MLRSLKNYSVRSFNLGKMGNMAISDGNMYTQWTCVDVTTKPRNNFTLWQRPTPFSRTKKTLFSNQQWQLVAESLSVNDSVLPLSCLAGCIRPWLQRASVFEHVILQWARPVRQTFKACSASKIQERNHFSEQRFGKDLTCPRAGFRRPPKDSIAALYQLSQSGPNSPELGFTHFHASLHLPVLPLCLCEGKRVFDCCNTRRWICNPFAVPAKSQQLRTLILQSHNPRLCKTWKMVKHLQLPETFHITSWIKDKTRQAPLQAWMIQWCRFDPGCDWQVMKSPWLVWKPGDWQSGSVPRVVTL